MTTNVTVVTGMHEAEVTIHEPVHGKEEAHTTLVEAHKTHFCHIHSGSYVTVREKKVELHSEE